MLNVMRGVQNLIGSPQIAGAWEAGQAVTVHGVIFRLETGLLDVRLLFVTPGSTCMDSMSGESREVTAGLRSREGQARVWHGRAAEDPWPGQESEQVSQWHYEGLSVSPVPVAGHGRASVPGICRRYPVRHRAARRRSWRWHQWRMPALWRSDS